MDNTSDPVIDRWRLQADGAPRPIVSMTWISGTQFDVAFGGGAVTNYAVLTQGDTDNNVFNTDGVLAQPPNAIRIAT